MTLLLRIEGGHKWSAADKRMPAETTYFPGRQLSPYGEYVKSGDLVVGHVYFRVTYVDKDTMIPELAPLVFIGHDLNAMTPGPYFQDAASYLAGDRVDWPSTVEIDDDGVDTTSPGGAMYYVLPAGEVTCVLEFEQAIALLLQCSLRRKSWNG
jgi:hypothetical protein